MFPVAEKITLYRLTENGQHLGLFTMPGDKVAMGMANSTRAEVLSKNKKTGEVTKSVHLFVPVTDVVNA